MWLIAVACTEPSNKNADKGNNELYKKSFFNYTMWQIVIAVEHKLTKVNLANYSLKVFLVSTFLLLRIV